MSAQRGVPGGDGPAQKIAPGSSFLSWGWAPEPLTRLQDVETGALRGTRMGVVIPAAGKLWEVHSGFSSIRCTCDAAPACTGQKGELHPLPTGTDEPLLPPTPGEWAELEQRTQLLGSVGPFLMATAERRGTTCTGEARQELHFAVTDLRSRKEVVLHDPGEESLVTMGPKSWAIRELLLDPEVPEAGTAKLAWVRPGWEGDELRVYYRYYAPSVEGKGDGIVAFNTRSVERSSGAPPRLLHPYAQRPSAISGLWDKDRPGGWAVAEPGVVPKGLFRSEP